MPCVYSSGFTAQWWIKKHFKVIFLTNTTAEQFTSRFMEKNFLQAFPCARLYIPCSKQSEAGSRCDHIFRANCKKRKSISYTILTHGRLKRTNSGKTTNKHATEGGKWISLWNSKHEPVTDSTVSGGTEAYSFINLEREACKHNIWKCFSPLEPGPHGSVIIHGSMTCMLSAGRGSRALALWNDFFFKPLVSDGGRGAPATTAIWRAAPHMEAITSNSVLRQFSHLKRNQWNSYPGLFLFPLSVLLLLAPGVQQHTVLMSAQPPRHHYCSVSLQ